MQFPSSLSSIQEMIDRIDPLAYGRSRNHLDGAVTRLSPYISRGVISTRQVMRHLQHKGYPFSTMEKLLQELAWRDYFQRVAQVIPNLAKQSIRQDQAGVVSDQMPAAIYNHQTGITGIDQCIQQLYDTGYMHNHGRMYVAALACNISHTRWQTPSQWMYYHLLDADFASNACSWQWVAGCFSRKRYVADQDNINIYCKTEQHGTYLDIPYEQLGNTPLPAALKEREIRILETTLPAHKPLLIDPALPVFIYTPYHLDPQWRKQEKANRVLLLDPDHFKEYPMSARTIQFILTLSQQIGDMQLFTGTIKELRNLYGNCQFISREHPLFEHVADITDEREWMFPEVQGFYPSFFSYWKKCKRYLTPNGA